MNSQGSGSAGSNLDHGQLTSALSGLSGAQNGINMASLFDNMKSGGMGDMLQSWLGDGQNQEISGSQISNLLGSNKVSAFASQLGISEEEAIGGLRDAMPRMIDNASSGGSLLDSAGGIGGVPGIARKLFGK